jgi:phosphotransferase system HPr-like phosphotransfer protein
MTYMHAKLAADICHCASKCRFKTYLKKGEVQVDAKSILGIISLFDTEDVEVICEDAEIKKELEELLNV